ncbi:hypothetical protein ATCC90586_011765 [Pythium insidiosum]|nr:hypothetical protein ATCC90586_011765 [Pythium insidiosum]
MRNFDVMFSSFQYITASICLADMLQWSAACYSIITLNVWFHWVLLLDAVTPPARSALSLRKRHAALAPLTDRVVLLRLSASTTVTLHSSTFMVYRLITVGLWLARLSVEAVCCPEHELMLIRGAVEYVSPLEVFPASAEPSVVPLDDARGTVDSQ